MTNIGYVLFYKIERREVYPETKNKQPPTEENPKETQMMKVFEKSLQWLSEGSWFILVGAALFLLIVIYRSYGWEGVSEALKKDVLKSATRFVPIVVAFILIMGSVSFLARKNPERVHDIVSGKEGQIKMMLISMAMPGPAGAKELRTSWEKGEKPSQIILCLTAMMAMGITMFIFRAGFLGPQLTLIWLGIGSFLIAEVWLAGKLVNWLCE